VLLLLLTLHIQLRAQQEDKGKPQEKEDKETQSRVQLHDYVLVEEEKPGLVPTVSVTTTKLPVSLKRTPFSVGVVTEQLLDSQRATVLGDALKNVSGTVSHTGFGVFDYFVIRGFDSLSNGLVTIDAAPEPEVTFYHLYNVERVEVVKGPFAFLYGGNPLAGSVNIVRKAPVFENLVKLGGSFGSFGMIRGDIDLNRVIEGENTAFRLNAFGAKSRNYRDSMENWQIGVNPAISFKVGQTSYVTANFEFVRNEFISDSGIPILNNEIPEVPRSRSYQSPFDSSDQNIYRVRLDYSTPLNSSVNLRSKFYYTDLEWLSDGTIFPAVLPGQDGEIDVYRSLLRLNDHQRLVGNQTEVIFSFSTASVRHEMLAGFEWSWLGDIFSLDVAALPSIDLFDPVETAAEPLFDIPSLAQAADTGSRVLAPYLVDQISITDRLKVTLGARLDDVDFKDDLSGLRRTSRHLSPTVGVDFLVQPAFTLYANYGQAFAPPSSQIMGDREPEESSQVEVGVKKSFMDDRFLLTAAVYQLEKKNIAIPDVSGVFRQQGDQRSRGFELDLSGELSSGLFLFASYAYTDAELTEFRELVDLSFGMYPPQLVDHSGNRPAFATEHGLNLWLLKELGKGISVAGGARYLSDQFIAPNNDFRIPGSLTFDSSLVYRRDEWRLSLNLRNLTGREIWTRGFGSTSVLPGNPFSVQLGVDFLR
jgi:TonB-dependent siderophore receptor